MTRPKSSACSSTENRLSKSTLMALLNTKTSVGFQVGDTVVYTKDNNQSFEYRVVLMGISTAEIANSNETLTVSKSLLKTKGPLTLFDKLESSEWSITSFDPRTGIVCVEIDNGTTTQTISVIVPKYLK